MMGCRWEVWIIMMKMIQVKTMNQFKFVRLDLYTNLVWGLRIIGISQDGICMQVGVLQVILPVQITRIKI